MAQGNVAIVQQVYQTMKDGDFPGMFSLIAPTLRIWQTEELPWGGHYEGLDEAKIFLGKVTAHLNASVALERFIDSGDFVLAIARTQGMTKTNGISFDVPLVHLWEVRDEKIVGLRVFLENYTMKKALAAESD